MKQETGGTRQETGKPAIRKPESESQQKDYVFRFRNFSVYRDARTFRLRISRFCRQLPPHEWFILRSQLRRAADSVQLNIAEGANRRTDADFSRFLNQALASLDEVVAALDIALDEAYLGEQEHDDLLSDAHAIGRQLLAFSARLKRENQQQKF